MKRAADAVARQIADQRIAALLRETLDTLANSVEPAARPHGANAFPHGAFPVAAEARNMRLDRGHGKARPRITEETVPLRRHIYIDEIAGADDPVARNPMRDFFIHADAGGPRKIIGKFRRGTGTLLLKERAAQRIKLARGHAGLYRSAHLRKRLRHDAAYRLEAFKFFFGGDNHGTSVTRE